MSRQSEGAIGEADLVLFMIDARAGVTPVDEHFAKMLRASGRPVVLVANKAESRAGESGILDAYSLGFGDPIAVSAEHGIGISDVLDAISDAMPPDEEGAPIDDEVEHASSEKPLHLAVIGQPNAGKSTLVNRVLGCERMLTGPEAGITRDTIAIATEWSGRPIQLFDTAGIRRRAKVVEKLEKLSVGDALRAIRFAEVVVLLMDAAEPFEKQDLQLAALVAEEGRALVLALNKWDLVADRDKRLRDLRADLEETLTQVRGVPMVPISARSGEGLEKLMKAVFDVYETWNKRVPTSALNRWLVAMTEKHPPPAVTGRRIKLKYLSQSKTRPPTFYLSCSRPEAVPDAYRRYLVNGLRDDFALAGVPIRLMVRAEKNPYEARKRKT
jgi:GTPase